MLPQTLWADAGIKTAYENRSRFQLNDSAAYYFDALDRIMQRDYKVGG